MVSVCVMGVWDWGEVRLTDSEEHEGDSEEEEEGDQSKVSAERCDPVRNDHLSTRGDKGSWVWDGTYSKRKVTTNQVMR